MESMLYRGHGFLGGIKHFWMAMRMWKMNLILEDLAPQKQTKMWPKRDLLWGLINIWQSESSAVSWIWITKPSTTFEPRNWACRKFVQSWFQNTSPTNKRKAEGMCAWTLLNALNMPKIFETCHNRWWIVDFWVRSQNQTTKFRVAHKHLTTPEESKNEQIENQIHANLFFQQSRCCL